MTCKATLENNFKEVGMVQAANEATKAEELTTPVGDDSPKPEEATEADKVLALETKLEKITKDLESERGRTKALGERASNIEEILTRLDGMETEVRSNSETSSVLMNAIAENSLESFPEEASKIRQKSEHAGRVALTSQRLKGMVASMEDALLGDDGVPLASLKDPMFSDEAAQWEAAFKSDDPALALTTAASLVVRISKKADVLRAQKREESTEKRIKEEVERGRKEALEEAGIEDTSIPAPGASGSAVSGSSNMDSIWGKEPADLSFLAKQKAEIRKQLSENRRQL